METCNSCKHFNPTPTRDNREKGECRRHAPIAVVTTDNFGSAYTYFPETTAADYCGDWEPKGSPAPDPYQKWDHQPLSQESYRAEQQRLGRMLRGVSNESPSGVNPHSFQAAAHRTILAALVAVESSGESTYTTVSVGNELVKRNQLESVGGLTYILQLFDLGDEPK